MKAIDLIKIIEAIDMMPKQPSLRPLKMSKTFETFIPDSKEFEGGEASDSGFDYEDREFDDIYELVDELRDNYLEDNGNWFTTADPERELSDGSETYYSFHPEVEKDEMLYLKYLRTLDNNTLESIKHKHRKEDKIEKELHLNRVFSKPLTKKIDLG